MNRLCRTPKAPSRLRPSVNMLCGLGLVVALSGCADLLARDRVPERTPAREIIQQPLQQVQANPAQPVRQQLARGSTTTLDPGSDRFLGTVTDRQSAVLSAARVEGADGTMLNLVGATIPEAAKVVLSDTLGLNYVIEANVVGKITLQSSTPLTRDALLEAFQTALELNGATLFYANGLVTVSPTTRAPPTFVSANDTRGYGRRIVVIPLQYISTREMIRLLEPIASADAVLRASDARNILMVSGSQSELDAILDAVNLFDVDVLEGKSVALVRLRAADPQSISVELAQIFESETGGSLEGVIDFIPNERLGSILVVTSRVRYLREAQDWIARLDASAGRAQRNSVIYALQNRTAEDLAPILASLLAARSSEGTAGVSNVEPGTLGAAAGSARIVADDTSNAIIAWATEVEHQEIAGLIRRLDATPTQVLLEATIAEVSLNDELDFGVRWFFESGNFSFAFSDLATGAVNSSFPGFSFLFDGGSAQVALNALSSVTDVNVVSSPSLLVLDNREAELRVGDQVPVATQSAVDVSDPNAPVVNSIDFRDTGVILKIRPRVGESGRVIMDIEQEVSDVVTTTTSGIDSPTIAQRLLRTSVAVNSGQTLALGGLIQDRSSLLQTKVPLLGDVPVVGELFKSKEDDIDRSELLILITPRVIRDANEARRVTDEFRQRLRAPDELLDGGPRKPRHQLQRLLQ